MASASAVASKGVPLAALLKELLASPSASGKAAASARCLSISKLFADSSDEDSVAAARHRERDLSIAKLFSGDVLDEATKMRLLLALTEDDVGVASRTGFSPRGWWVSKEDADAVKLKVAMPGLGKEHVKVWADQDELAIEGEGDKDTEHDDEEEAPAWYGHRIEFPADTFKMDQIKAEMKHGVLKVTVPKIKLEEREDVFVVKVE